MEQRDPLLNVGTVVTVDNKTIIAVIVALALAGLVLGLAARLAFKR